MSHETPFISASTTPREFKIVSEIASAPTHWESSKRRARLCAEDDCKLCRDGWGVRDRYLLRLEDEGGFHSLMEFSERHREILREVLGHQRAGRTCVVEVWKTGNAQNSPVALDILRVVSTSRLYDVRNLIKANYLPAILVEEEAKIENNSASSPVGRIQDNRFGMLDADIAVRAAALEARRELWD